MYEIIPEWFFHLREMINNKIMKKVKNLVEYKKSNLVIFYKLSKKIAYFILKS
jgi:hypothetical protein